MSRHLEVLISLIRAEDFSVPELIEKYGAAQVLNAKHGAYFGLLGTPAPNTVRDVNTAYQNVKKEVLEAVLKAQIFVYSKWSPYDQSKDLETEEIASLPFEAVWIESKGDYLIESDNIIGTLVYEFAPGEIRTCNLSKSKSGKLAAVRYIPDFKTKGGQITIRNIEYNLWNLSSKGNVGSVSLKSKIKVGKVTSSGNNEIKKISNVIYIKQPQEPKESLFEGREIDFSYRFIVRGHWRKFDGIGKDRNGNRSINGFTWVIPHERGPDDAILISNKTRLVD